MLSNFNIVYHTGKHKIMLALPDVLMYFEPKDFEEFLIQLKAVYDIIRNNIAANTEIPSDYAEKAIADLAAMLKENS